MHYALLPSILPAVLCALIVSQPALGHLTPPSLPFQLPDYNRHRVSSPSLITQFRDGIIYTIWGPPPVKKSCYGTVPRRKDTTPQKLLARFGEDIVVRFNISSAEEAKALAEATNILFLDVWEFTSSWADIRLSKDVVPSLLGLLPQSLQRAHTPLMHDLAQAIFESYPSPALQDQSPPQEPKTNFGPSLRPQRDETNVFFRDYQPLSVIHPWMRLLESLFPTHVRLISIGTTFEGRDILALRVGVRPATSDKPAETRKTVVISAGSHAREWISTSSVNYAAYSLITSYGRSRPMTKLMEEFDWVFIPTLNPDGYVYTWESDRLWRKNRQDTNLRFCKGMDLDRSYSFQWDGEATKGNPCSESFSGGQPFEAVESLRFANWVKNETQNNNVSFVGFLDFHSYSQQILYPFSYSCVATPPTLENLEELGLGLAKAIKQTDSKNYGVTSACEGSVTADEAMRKEHRMWPRLETGGGSALDYMYHEMHVKYAYQIKLRDKGSYGFLLPSKHIVPTGKEVFGAISYLGKYLLSNRGIETTDDSPSTEGFVIITQMQQPESENGGSAIETEVEGHQGNSVDL